jgi:eukaryotic-like serine/threonine-protein kinase
MTNAPDFDAACGHSVPPRARFCPVCGRPRVAAPVPPRVSRPAAPPQWPWEVSDDDDDLHAVYSDPTVVPELYAETGALHDPRAGGPRRLVLPMIAVAVAIIVITAVAVMLLSRHPGNASATNDSATVKATRSAAPSPSPDYAQLRATPEGQAAVALAGLLQQAADQLGKVSGATADVRDCGLKLPADATVFYSAAGDRRRLLSDLPHLTDRSALPTALLQDLTSDWQESNTRYTDLGHWTDNAIYDGCVKQDIGSDANLRDSYVPGDEAALDRESFVTLWAPIADKYALPTYPAGLL